MPSSVIQSFTHHKEEDRLIVRFASGLVYVYEGVPTEIVEGLRAAPSRGSYFNTAIRDRFRFARDRSGSR